MSNCTTNYTFNNYHEAEHLLWLLSQSFIFSCCEQNKKKLFRGIGKLFSVCRQRWNIFQPSCSSLIIAFKQRRHVHT